MKYLLSKLVPTPMASHYGTRGGRWWLTQWVQWRGRAYLVRTNEV